MLCHSSRSPPNPKSIPLSLSTDIWHDVIWYIHARPHENVSDTLSAWLSVNLSHASTPNLPTNIAPTKIAWLKLPGEFPMGLKLYIYIYIYMFHYNYAYIKMCMHIQTCIYIYIYI